MKSEVNLGILATLKAKPGKEAEVEQFLKSALPLANQETATVVWFAVRLDSSTFGIFDAFANETGREAHLSGPIAAALMAKWKGLLAEPPNIKKVDIRLLNSPASGFHQSLSRPLSIGLVPT